MKVEVTRQIQKATNLNWRSLHNDANLHGFSIEDRFGFSSIPAAEVLENSKQLAGLPRRSWARPSVYCHGLCLPDRELRSAGPNKNNETCLNALAFPCVISVLINWRIRSQSIFCSSHGHTDCKFRELRKANIKECR